MLTLKRTLCLGLVAALAAPLFAKSDIGDPAAPLKVKEWIQGEPIEIPNADATPTPQTDPQDDRPVMVVEFWATWCPPCVESIPHLSSLQKKYGDKVAIIGVTSEDAGTVKPFVKEKGDKMNYRVVIDDDGKTAAGYMEAYGARGIPHAFIVNREGHVVWQGHPLSESFDPTLERVIKQGMTVKQAKQFAAEEQQREEQLMALMEKGNAYINLAADPETTPEALNKAGAVFLDAAKDEPAVLASFAEFLLSVDRSMIPHHDVAFIEKVAHTALKREQGDKTGLRITYANALKANGKPEQGAEQLQKAIAEAEDAEMKAQLEKMLANFRAAA